MNRDARLEIDEPALGLEEPQRAPDTFELGVDGLAGEERPRTCSRRSASRMARSPIVARAVNPVPTPSSIRPGASRLSDATAFAVTGAMRFEGTSTPLPRWIRDVLAAASARPTNTSAHSICVS